MVPENEFEKEGKPFDCCDRGRVLPCRVEQRWYCLNCQRIWIELGKWGSGDFIMTDKFFYSKQAVL